MASPKFLKSVVCLLLVCIVIGAPKARAEVTCGQVVRFLTPCLNYVANGGATVPAECCNGVKNLNGAAQTTPDRQAVCKCIKSVVSGVPYTGFNLGLASGLPGKCGVNVPYKIDPSTNCEQIKRV